MKFAHHELGDNYADTFRVENGVIRVMYDKYDDFGTRFGHLFYKKKLSHYVLALEYRFFGEQVKGGPSYAKLNSGVMVHSQAPETILKEQDWPISVEAQFLAGDRTTMNVCTPGTEIYMNGQMVKAHCTNSSSRKYGDEGWIAVEVEVLGGESIRHLIDGDVGARVSRSRRSAAASPTAGIRRSRRTARSSPRATSACRPRASRSSSATSGC